MLIKLIKYDLRRTARTFVPIYSAVLVICSMIMFCYAKLPDVFTEYASSAAVGLVYLIRESIFTLLALIIPVTQFYRCFLTDESYLLMTIPASPSAHIVSKLVCTAVWYAASLLCSKVVSLVATIAFGFFQLMEETVTINGTVILYALLNFIHHLLFLIMLQLLIYMSMMLSTLSPKNVIALSADFCMTGALILGIIYVKYTQILSLKITDLPLSESTFFKLANCAFFAFFSIIFYLITRLILKKSYNLP